MDAGPHSPNRLDALELLNREVAAADAVAAYSPVLTLTDACIAAPAGYVCDRCCHWSLPLNAPYVGRDTPHGVALHFNEWLAWHYHIIRHQRLNRMFA